jgi:hypothetical protein
VDLDPRTYLIDMAQTGVDPWWAYAYSTTFDSIREQRWADVSPDGVVLTEQPPVQCAAVIEAS